MTTDEKEAEWVALHDDEDEEEDEGGRRRERVLSPRHGFSVCAGQDGWCVLFGGVDEKTGMFPSANPKIASVLIYDVISESQGLT